MPSDDKMSLDERRKYLKLVMPRYAKAGRVKRWRNAPVRDARGPLGAGGI